jgi:serine/threonine protein kinase
MLSGVSQVVETRQEELPVLPPGTLLRERYRIENELGRGGFGAVYRAWDMNLNKACAVKENLETSSDSQRQFAREATVLANLSHPNLPRVTDHFVIPGQGQYLVMDFVEGEDLASLLQKQRIIPVEQALGWILQVADALNYLHTRVPPVVHRDIKPANIRLTPEGKAMLVDFGLVKMYDPHRKTTLGARAVTPGFAPPEQYGQGSTDTRSDIYSLGATLYTLMTGQDPTESVLRIGQDTMPPAQQVNPAIPPALGQVVSRAMALSPSQRYQSATSFSADLRAASSKLTSQSFPAGQGEVKSTVSTSAPPHSGEKGYGAGMPPASQGPVMVELQPQVAVQPSAVALPQTRRKFTWALGAVGLFLLVTLFIAISAWMAWDNRNQEQIRNNIATQVAATRTARANVTATPTPIPSSLLDLSNETGSLLLPGREIPLTYVQVTPESLVQIILPTP